MLRTTSVEETNIFKHVCETDACAIREAQRIQQSHFCIGRETNELKQLVLSLVLLHREKRFIDRLIIIITYAGFSNTLYDFSAVIMS